MRAEFTTNWELVLIPENAAENLALQAWSDRYFDADRTKEQREKEPAYLLVTAFKESESFEKK